VALLAAVAEQPERRRHTRRRRRAGAPPSRGIHPLGGEPRRAYTADIDVRGME